MKPATRKKKIKIEVPMPEREPAPFLTEWTCTGFVRGSTLEWDANSKNGTVNFGAIITNSPSRLIESTLPIPASAFSCVQQGMTLRIRVEVFA